MVTRTGFGALSALVALLLATACKDKAAEEAAAAQATAGAEVAKPPQGPVLALGNGASCALRMDGQLACWGKLSESAPEGRFLSYQFERVDPAHTILWPDE